MMLLVDGAGYATAESAFVEGNQVAAVAHERLAGALSSCSAGMAGNDTSSEAFAASYDTAAADAVGALADLVSSFSGLGELTRASLANHHRAEARSVVGGGTVYEGGLLPRGSCVDVLPSPPPVSLGGDSPSVPAHLAMVLDHVQGFVWPSADTAQLRLAAAAWSGAADAVDDLATYCDCAVRGFWDERSPEVPLAVDATHELRDTVRDLAAEYAALAAACSAYADQVEARRAEVVALAEWLLEQVVEGIVISVALGCLTGGAGAAAGLAATAARIAAESPRFLRIIEALAAFARALSDTTRVARESVVLARARLAKFSAARGERGALQALPDRPGGWLRGLEGERGHVISRHVGRSLDQLAARARAIGGDASTFHSVDEAETAISSALRHDRRTIQDWLASGNPDPLRLDGTLAHSTGTTVTPSGAQMSVHGVRVILVRDPSMPEGYWIKTAFPQP